MKKTSQSVSTTLTQGKLSLRAEMDRRNQQSTFEIYRRLDLGPGGYAIAPSTNTRHGVRLALRENLADDPGRYRAVDESFALGAHCAADGLDDPLAT
ncbi:MAG TPA: hypothetical protein VN647_10815 [Nitrospira sp.]|nr:hypothetical protein [Nitrospira sp.]